MNPEEKQSLIDSLKARIRSERELKPNYYSADLKADILFFVLASKSQVKGCADLDFPRRTVGTWLNAQKHKNNAKKAIEKALIDG